MYIIFKKLRVYVLLCFWEDFKIMKRFCGRYLRVVEINMILFNFFKYLCEKLVMMILREICIEWFMKVKNWLDVI